MALPLTSSLVCITKSMSLEVVKFLEEYFSYTLEDYRKSKPKNEDWHKYISDTIVEKDNIDLFNFLWWFWNKNE